MKLMYLTSVLTLPIEKGEQKIKEATEEDGGHIDYESMGIRAPKGKPIIDENGHISLLEDEIEYAGVSAVLNIDEFSSCVDNEKIGSVIYTKDGGELWVHETVEEVSDYVEYLTLSDFSKWWIGFKISVKSFRFSNLFRRKRKISLEEILSRPENQIDYKQE